MAIERNFVAINCAGIPDTLIEAGVARSRSEALAWCVRLVEQHTDSWLEELREAMSHVADVRDRGPAA